MIKAVFFDWFTTLSRFEPAREKMYCEAFSEHGVTVPVDVAERGMLLGDEYLYTINIKTPLIKLPLEVREEMYQCFSKIIAAELKIEVAPAAHKEIRERIKKTLAASTYILYEDVLPTFKKLKEKGFALGLITNLREDITVYTRKLGLEPYLTCAVTSETAGFPKPDPRIFKAALERAGVEGKEAIFVGDQYRIDVVGARGADIQPVLIDRCNLYPDITDCPRISTLPEVEKFLS